MGDTNTETPPATDDGAIATGTDNPDSDAPPAGGGEATEAPPTDEGPLGRALAALEGLTEAVELLGTGDATTAQPRLVELAGQLRGFADGLAGTTGSEDPAAPDANTKPDAAPQTDALAQALAAVRATLERVGSMIEQEQRTPSGSDPSAPEADTEDGGKPAATIELGGQLEALNIQVRSLADTVKAQQQRLSRLEKRSGLPNSTPRDERPTPASGDDDVGWPLDLNRTCDRESVDKSVSFHEA